MIIADNLHFLSDVLNPGGVVVYESLGKAIYNKASVSAQ